MALFGSYAQSIESPTGWDINPIGESVPAETGIGFEGGVKFEFLEGRLSGQVSLFDITKENDMLSTLGTPQLERLYPVADYPLLYDDPDGTGFSPSGRKVAGIDTQSRGVELDLYYNPSKELSLFLGYAYSDALFQSGPNDPVSGQALLQKGQRVPGTAKHSANFTARYNFTDGKLKGTYVGTNLKYRSKSYYNRLYADVGSDSRQNNGNERDYEGGVGPGFYDGRPDLFPNVDSNGDMYDSSSTQFYDIWLDDTLTTSVFIGWSGRLFDQASQAPRYSFQLSVDNLFDCRDLYASGKNPRYTDGRRIRLKASIKF
tara:strand:- start:606 stop:1553 length:948 start_codon:yes stop_codon:yes gene_type:complete